MIIILSSQMMTFLVAKPIIIAVVKTKLYSLKKES